MNRLMFFLRRFQILLVFILLQVLSLYLYFSFSSYPQSQVLTTASTINGKLLDIHNGVIQHMNLRHNNTVLQKKNSTLMKERLESFIRIDNRTVKINDTIYKQQYEYIPSEISNSTVTRSNNYFTIRGGKKQDISVGMGVISDRGIVGVIHVVGEHYSIVKSVLTENINTSVLIEEIGLFGLLKWDGHDPTIGWISGVSNDQKIPIGSKVVTRENSGIFPKGILVGHIVSIDHIEGEAFWKVSIRFSEDYRKLQRVYVVKNFLFDEQQEIERIMDEKEN